MIQAPQDADLHVLLNRHLLADCALAAELARHAMETGSQVALAALQALDLPASQTYRHREFEGLL